MPEKYTNEQVATSLRALNEKLSPDEAWSLKNKKLYKTFKFKNFITAFGWMTQVAIWAEKLKHHPEWFNVYNRVEVELTTHDVDGISELDFKLAEKMELLK